MNAPKKTQAWKRTLNWTAHLIGLWLICSFCFAYFATRRPHAPFAEPVPEIKWGKIESLRLTTADGEELGAWFIAGRPDRPTVLLLHGHRGQRAACLAQAEVFASAGCSTMLITSRANGDSTGNYDDIGYTRHDVVAAIDWLETHHKNQPIIIYGQSMGAAAAAYAAADLRDRTHGYILESPFQDLRTAVWNRVKNHLPGPLSPLRYVGYSGLLAVSPLVLPELDQMSPRDAVAAIPPAVPVLILAGSVDHEALPEEAQAIYEQIRNHAELEFIPGGHGGLQSADPNRYREILVGFIARHTQK